MHMEFQRGQNAIAEVAILKREMERMYMLLGQSEDDRHRLRQENRELYQQRSDLRDQVRQLEGKVHFMQELNRTRATR